MACYTLWCLYRYSFQVHWVHASDQKFLHRWMLKTNGSLYFRLLTVTLSVLYNIDSLYTGILVTPVYSKSAFSGLVDKLGKHNKGALPVCSYTVNRKGLL